MKSEINIMKLRKNDTVALRCGVTLKIIQRDRVGYDTCSYFLEGTSSQPVTWFYDGKFGYSGEHPFDIIGVVRKVKPKK